MHDLPKLNPDNELREDRLTSLFDWVAAKDPMRAARLLAEYLRELAQEQDGSEPASST